MFFTLISEVLFTIVFPYLNALDSVSLGVGWSFWVRANNVPKPSDNVKLNWNYVWKEVRATLNSPAPAAAILTNVTKSSKNNKVTQF